MNHEAKHSVVLSPARRELLSLLLAKRGIRTEPAEGIPKRRESGPCPLSFAQEQIWFFEQFEPGTAVYNIAHAVRLTGRLNLTALSQTFNEILRRHEILRTGFTSIEGKSVQSVSPATELPLPVRDLSHLAPAEREIQAARLIDEESQRLFDLTKGPLLRCLVLRLASAEHLAVLCMHHIASDGWSIGVLLREIAGLYESFSSGRPPVLPELTVQYADFAQWQRQQLEGKLLNDLDYWKSQLEGATTTLNLPTSQPRPSVQTFRGAREKLVLSMALSRALRELGRQHGVTIFMLMLGAFMTLLYRYTGQDDLVVGTPVANRSRVEIEKLIGFFVNTLVLRTDLSGDPSFVELLARVREVALAAYAHQELPFEKLVQELQPERNLSQSPLFQVFFALQNTPITTLEIPGLKLTPVETNRATAKFDLFLGVADEEQGLSMALEYNRDLFDARVTRQLLRHLNTLLESVVANPETPVSKLCLVNELERQQTLTKGNGTTFGYDRDIGLTSLFEQQAERVPDRISVEFESQQLSYAELNARTNQLAHYLARLGVGPEVLVGIFMERSVDMLVSVLAVLKAGGAYVPLDPAYPAERLAFMLKDAGVSVLLLTQSLRDRLPDHGAAVVLLDADRDAIAQESEENLGPRATGNNLAYVIYTSGSTGLPKGTQITRSAVVNFLRSMQQEPGLDQDDVLLAVTTLSFDIAALELYLPLIVGARLVIAGREMAANGTDLLRRLESTSVMQATPATWRLLLDAGWEKPFAIKLLCGGEALPRELATQLQDRAASLWNMYGPTETTIWSALQRVERSDGPVSIGRPIANTHIYLLDRNYEPVPTGAVGELYIGGDGVARGYLHRYDLTAERFIPDQFSGNKGARLYRTGDLARYGADGSIEYLGRIDQQLKIRGHRIEPGEIEAMLAQHPAVSEAVVVAREVQSNHKQLVAYIVPNKEYQSAPELVTSSAQAERVSEWELAWNETYKSDAVIRDPTFNITGWNSSYTGEPIPSEEMREWLDGIVERISAIGTGRALEIGCGTGLLLFRLAHHFTEYHGTDFSPAALGYVRQQLDKLDRKLPQVTLSERAADDFEGFESKAYDVLILNSVVQYFPSLDYFMRVLKGALRVVRDRGAVFLGDLRNLRLLPALHLGIELQRAPALLPVSDLSYRVQQRAHKEKELCIDPVFFEIVKGYFPEISRVEVQLKRGRHHNELTRFRYDVVLHVGPECDHEAKVTLCAWRDVGGNLSTVRSLLRETDTADLVITDIPNARLQPDAQAVAFLQNHDVAQTVGDLVSSLSGIASDNGVEPEDLWSISGDDQCSIEITWPKSGALDSFDAIFKQRWFESAVTSPRALSSATPEETPQRTWSHFANNPLQAVLERELVPELRRYATKKLPEYLLPALYLLIEKLPLTPNGKVDRKTLPAPSQSRQDASQPYVAARTPVERTLVSIWSEVLATKQVGIHDNFFSLGGDSILSIQAIARAIRAGLHCTPRQLFQHQTIAGLAEAIDSTAAMSAAKGVEVDSDSPGQLEPEDLRRAIAQVEFEGDSEVANKEIEAVYFLSPAQEGMLFHSLHSPDEAVYILQLSCTFRALDLAAIQRAWQTVVERHAVLRTAFVWENITQPVQVVCKGVKLPWRQLDWRDLSAQPQAERFESYLQDDRNRGFQLSRAPLMRLTLIQIGEDSFKFVWTYHHLLLDGWAIFLVLREFFQFYEAFANSQQLQLEPPVPFSEYIAWLEKQDSSEAETFWRSRLKGFQTPTPLFPVTGRLTERDQGVAEDRILLPETLVAEIQSLAQERKLTLNTVIQGAWALILSYYSRTRDVVFGVTTSGRPPELPGIESMVGIFLNVLPLRTQLLPDASLWSWLEQLQVQQFGLRQYEYSRLVQVQRWSEIARGLPLFESILSFENYPIDDSLNAYSNSLEIADMRNYSETNYPVTLIVAPRGSLSVRLVYDRQRFNQVTISQVLEMFATLLRSFVSQPNARLKTMEEILTRTEQRQRLLEQQANDESKRSKFKTIKPRPVSLPRELVTTSSHAGQILAIEPAVGQLNLTNWATNKLTYLEAELAKHGAVLLHGFKVNSVEKFEEVAAAICPDLFGDYGDLPREDVGGRVYGSTPYPATKPILFHNESSHLPRWPMKIWFHCVQAATEGGETPLVDCRKIYQRLPARIRERFAQKKLMYVRNYIEGLDVSWQSFFKTTDRAGAEESCRQAGMGYEWFGDSLRTRQVCQAVTKHPTTGEMIFFNQLQLHHVSCLEPSVRDTLLSMYSIEELPRNVCYGDGTPIEDSLVEEICELYHQTSVSFPWEPGDILMLDNMLMAHGRNPYVGPRKIVVAMGQMYCGGDAQPPSAEAKE